MKSGKVLIFIFLLYVSINIFSQTNSLTIVLEDFNSPCQIYINGGLLGEVRDSIVLTDLERGTYKVSMFSEMAFDKTKKDEDYAMKGIGLSDSERNLKKHNAEFMQKIINKGTETVFLTKSSSQRVMILNRTVNNMIRDNRNAVLFCLGAACLGFTLLTGTLIIVSVILGIIN